MGLREDLGGKVEEALNKAVDKYVTPEMLTSLIIPQLESLLKTQTEKLKQQLKADVIDLIDGVDDIK